MYRSRAQRRNFLTLLSSATALSLHLSTVTRLKSNHVPAHCFATRSAFCLSRVYEIEISVRESARCPEVQL